MQDTSPKEVIIVCRRVCPSKRLCRTEQHCSPQSSGEIVRQLLSRTRREYMCFVSLSAPLIKEVALAEGQGQGPSPCSIHYMYSHEFAPGTASWGRFTELGTKYRPPHPCYFLPFCSSNICASGVATYTIICMVAAFTVFLHWDYAGDPVYATGLVGRPIKSVLHCRLHGDTIAIFHLQTNLGPTWWSVVNPTQATGLC